MSVSSWPVTALALRPPGHILDHQIDRPDHDARAAPRRRRWAFARNEPRSLKHAHHLAVADAAGRGVLGVDGEARLALAPHEDRLGREGGVQEVMGGRRDEGERVPLRELGSADETLSRGGT